MAETGNKQIITATTMEEFAANLLQAIQDEGMVIVPESVLTEEQKALVKRPRLSRLSPVRNAQGAGT